jgi:hypothetical protein
MSAKAATPTSRYKTKQDDATHLWFSSDLVDDDIPDDYKISGSKANESLKRRPHEQQFRWSEGSGEKDQQELLGEKRTYLTLRDAFLLLSLCLLIAGFVGIVFYTTRSLEEHQQLATTSIKPLAAEPYNFSDVRNNDNTPESIIFNCFRNLNDASSKSNNIDNTVPLFWDIPQSGGSFVQQVLGCLHVDFVRFNPINVKFPKIRDHTFSTVSIIIMPLLY